MPDLTPREIESLVVHYFCSGIEPGKIRETLALDHHVTIGRADAWKILGRAAKSERLRSCPAFEDRLAERIRDTFPDSGLVRIRVIETAVRDDVSIAAAEFLLELILEHHTGKAEVHIGWAGGRSLRRVAKAFADLLHTPPRGFPEEIVFHAMVAGWDVTNPVDDPNSFFGYFAGDDLSLGVKTRFVGLHGPGIVETQHREFVRSLIGVRPAFEAVSKIQVVVTSAGRWECGHSALFDLFKPKSPESTESASMNCVGDMMWSPLGSDGPIEFADFGSPLETLTLMRLDELHDFITANSKQVLLVLGPCGECGEPKSEVLRTILRSASRRRLATHLVCDSRAARAVSSPEPR